MNSSLELLPSGNFSDGSLAANVTVDLNGTLVNVSSTDANGASDVGSIVFTVLLAVVLGAITLMTVIGNIFVICAIRMDRNLRTAQNYLVFSLAVADLMVSIFVMPLSAVQEVNGGWKLGAILCDIWTFADVMSCTASILHLLAIALDRYWAVTNIDYIQRRSANRILTILAFVWGVALTVSLAPLLGWKDPDFEKRILENTCMVSQDKAYQIFATFSTFYGPLVVILLLYWKIYQVARKRIRNKPGCKSIAPVQKTPPKDFGKNSAKHAPASVALVSEEARHQLVSQSSPALTVGHTSLETNLSVEATNSLERRATSSGSIERSDQASCDNNCNKPPSTPDVSPPRKRDSGQKRTTKESRDSKKERKTAKILAIITGVFIVCWLPFFVMALILTLMPDLDVPKLLLSFILWLGYANSLLNPVIYTIFSPDFRNAFRRMLFGRKANRR